MKSEVIIDNSLKIEERSGTFIDNMKLPVHSWYKYSAGYSAKWAEDILQPYTSENIILDPFVGSGTSCLAANAVGVNSIGFEAHPFIFRISRAKLYALSDIRKFTNAAERLLLTAETLYKNSNQEITQSPELLQKCFEADNLMKLESLRLAYISADLDDETSHLCWLLITSIIRPCSSAGTAQWQYLLPNRKKHKISETFECYRIKLSKMLIEMEYVQESYNKDVKADILLEDARTPFILPENSVDFVITSPPYPNNYDYADATRLEMTFWRDIKGWGCLHDKIRKELVVSCSQHSAKNKIELDDLLESEFLNPIKDEISLVCRELEEVRKTKGGKKTYHTMIASYFIDLSRIIQNLREYCKDGSEQCWVIGDSAPYGVYVPVDKWLDILFKYHGFKSTRFEKIRDRNIKWKNRKHRVPLKEGRLWVKG